MVNHVSDKGFVSKIYKEFSKFNSNHNKPVENDKWFEQKLYQKRGMDGK